MTGFEEVAGVLGLRQRGSRPASPFEFIERIENGLPLAALDHLCRFVAPSDINFKHLIVSRATLARRKKRHDKLSAEESDRLVRLAKGWRSEEHTSELQSHSDLVCRPLLGTK